MSGWVGFPYRVMRLAMRVLYHAPPASRLSAIMAWGRDEQKIHKPLFDCVRHWRPRLSRVRGGASCGTGWGSRASARWTRRSSSASSGRRRPLLEEVTAETRFTATMLCRMHGDWLGSIYEWAGRYRTVEMEKDGFRWPPAYWWRRTWRRSRRDCCADIRPCPPGPLPEVARRIAEVHAELLLIHPFREGNGRLARWLADLMAIQAGLSPPDYGFEGRGARSQKGGVFGSRQSGLPDTLRHFE